MKIKTRVLVTGFGGDVARGVVASIKESQLPVEVITTGLRHEPAFGHHPQPDYTLPGVNSSEYLETLKSLLERTRATHLIPCTVGESHMIAEAVEASQFGGKLQVLCNSSALVDVFLDKMASMQFIQSGGIPVPETYLLSQISDRVDQLGQSIIIKPRFGWGSRDVQRLSLLEFKALNACAPPNQDMVVQRDFGDFGFEFTAGVYVSPRSGIGRACILRRTLQDGRSWCVRRHISLEIEDQLIDFSKSIGATYLNFQGFIAPNDEFVIFEVNPRLSGSVYFQSPVMNVPAAWLIETTGHDYTFPDDPGDYSGYRLLSDVILRD